MHRATPANSSFRSYVAGGARATVGSIDDSKQMQEHGSSFMKNEKRSAIESPQNYGFTSVCMGPDKDKQGNTTGCAETFINFMGGNRSFPVAGNMDDRRHRLNGLDPGDSAMFRTAQDMLQFHFAQSGGFMTGPRDKTLRMQLLDQDSQQQQGAGSSQSGAGGSGQQQSRGQKSLYKQGQSSYRYMHLTKDETVSSGDNVRHKSNDNKVYYELDTKQQSYLGKRDGSFAKVITLNGPCIDVFGRFG